MAKYFYILPLLLLTLTCAKSQGVFNPHDYLGESIPGEYLHVHYPPDPVNPKTGNFYLPVQDLYLPCFGFPLEVYRSYNSFSRMNGSFGIGWTFNYDIRINIGLSGTIKIVEPDGFVNEYEPLIKSTEQRGPVIDKIIEARKAEDRKYSRRAKPDEHYDEIRIKLDTDTAFFNAQRRRYLNDESIEIKDGTYTASARGLSTIIKDKDSYTRIRRDGTKELYDAKGSLLKIEDRNGNSLSLSRNASGFITRVSNACSQYLNISYDQNSKITAITDSLGRRMQYEYDKAGNLVKSLDSVGNLVLYSYNKQGLMDAITYEGNKKISLSYDKTGRVSKQSGPNDKITTYEYKKRGSNYVSTTVKDNKGFFNTYTYISNENKTIVADKEGKQTVTVISRSCSKPISITDGKGKGETYEYDDQGQLTTKRDAQGNVYKYKYTNIYVDQVSEISDQKGNKLSFLYDPKGNLTYANLNKTRWIKIRYESHGKIQSLSDHDGNLVSFIYNNMGKPTLMEKKLKNKTVASVNVSYRNTGEIEEIKYKPSDVKTADDFRKTLNDMLELLKPAGIDFKI